MEQKCKQHWIGVEIVLCFRKYLVGTIAVAVCTWLNHILLFAFEFLFCIDAKLNQNPMQSSSCIMYRYASLEDLFVSYIVTKSINGYSLLSLEYSLTLSTKRLSLIRIKIRLAIDFEWNFAVDEAYLKSDPRIECILFRETNKASPYLVRFLCVVAVVLSSTS